MAGKEISSSKLDKNVSKFKGYLTAIWCECPNKKVLCTPGKNVCHCKNKSSHSHCYHCGGIMDIT